MAANKGTAIDLSALDARELAGLQEQLDAEVQSLTQSAVTLQRAAASFGKSGRAVEQLAQQQEGEHCPFTRQTCTLHASHFLYLNMVQHCW